METPETDAIFPSPPPDSEIFQRVWSKVMGEGGQPSDGVLPVPLSCPEPSPASPDCNFLLPLMDLSARRTAAFRAMARRGGPSCRSLSALADRCREQFCRLSTAHFLITGQRYLPRCSPPPLPRDGALALRDRWLECIRWQTLCENAGQATAEPVLSQLLRELSREGAAQAALLRGLLEKRCSLP